MNPLLEDAVLSSDLDCQLNNLANLAAFLPTPGNIVDQNDPRLTDQRALLPGTVDDFAVNALAGIQQSKLNLDGAMPGPWIGNGANQAAQGNLYLPVAQKGAASGYAALDSNGRIPSGQITPTANTGTVTTVTLQLPKELNVTTPMIDDAGSLTAVWAAVPNNSWLGLASLASDVPTFSTALIPDELLPNLDASKFTTGTFSLNALPIAVGLGVGHAQGLVPDPGVMGHATDYLGRDMVWKPFATLATYQPNLTPPNISLLSYNLDGSANVVIQGTNTNANLFYSTGSGYSQAPGATITIKVTPGTVVQAYSARAGWNNSAVNSFIPPTST